MHVSQTITINRPPEEIYRFWHDLPNLPRFMSHIEAVDVIDERRSHWRAKAPAGSTVEWDSEIVEDQPGRSIAWRSLEGSDVRNDGRVSVVPAPGDRGTEVRVELDYDLPGGKLAAVFAKMFGEEPAQQVYDDLHALKQVLETGEVVRSDATSIEGRMRKHPGQPPTAEELQGD